MNDETTASRQINLKTATREDFIKASVHGEFTIGYVADHFIRYAKPWFIGRFMARYEVFKMIAGVHGSIIECGCGSGDGVLTWVQIARQLEPRAFRRLVYAFDTFSGFPSVSEKDGEGTHHCVGAMQCGASEMGLAGAVEMFRMIEPVVVYEKDDGATVFNPAYVMKVPFPPALVIKGDFTESGPNFVKEAPHLVVSLLSLDFDLYEPTKLALELFLPRMPKGAVILFDELDHHEWPGETLAVAEKIGIPNLRLRRFSWEPTMSYAVLE